MHKLIARLVVAAALALAVLPVHARAELSPPQQVVQHFYDTLLDVMKQGRSLGFSGRYDRLKPEIAGAFNLPLMSRLSVGPQWSSLSQAQQSKMTEAFSDFTVSTYANRFDDYGGERLELLPGTSEAAGGVIVQSRFVKSDGDPVSLNYLMRESDGKWQIVDVFLSGTISELAARRSEFTSVLQRDGPQGLLDLLDRRIAALKVS